MKKFITLMLGILSFSFAMAVVNLNTATKQELETLNGVGPAKAQAIIDYRTKNGAFKTVEDFKNVPGIGEKTFEKLKNDISVGGKTTVPAKGDTSKVSTPASKSNQSTIKK